MHQPHQTPQLPAQAPGINRPASGLLQRVSQRARYLHYSLRTEQAYVYWVRFFVRWHGMRHPRDMGPPEVEAFLSMLAASGRCRRPRTTKP